MSGVTLPKPERETQKQTTNLPALHVLHPISPLISRLTPLHEALS